MKYSCYQPGCFYHSPFHLIEGDIDLLLEKFYQENQGHISSSLSASANKSTALNGTGAAVCTSKEDFLKR